MLLLATRFKPVTAEQAAHLAGQPRPDALVRALDAPADEGCASWFGHAEDFIRDVLVLQQVQRPRAEDCARRASRQRPTAVGIGAQQHALASQTAQPRAEVLQHPV